MLGQNFLHTCPSVIPRLLLTQNRTKITKYSLNVSLNSTLMTTMARHLCGAPLLGLMQTVNSPVVCFAERRLVLLSSPFQNVTKKARCTVAI